MNKFNKIGILLAVFVLIAGGLYFIWKHQSSPVQKTTDKPETLRVFPGPGPAASLFQIAEKKGFFNNENLEVRLQNYEAGPQSITDLQKNKLDVAHPAEYAFVTNSFNKKNKNLRIIGSVIRHSGVEMVARKDHEILNPSDITGKKIGLALGTQSEFALAEFLTQNQIRIEDVTLIDIQSRQKGVEALINGEVDAHVTINQFVYESKKKLGDNAISWWLQEGFSSYPLLVTTKEKLDKNPEAYKKLLRALDKAIDYANEHPDETKQAAINANGYKKDFLDFYWQRIRFEMSLPQELLLVMENQARWLINKNLVNVSKVPNYLDYIYPDAMETVKPEAITIIK